MHAGIDAARGGPPHRGHDFVDATMRQEVSNEA
jgi:hypothetical protein